MYMCRFESRFRNSQIAQDSLSTVLSRSFGGNLFGRMWNCLAHAKWSSECMAI